MAPSVSYTHLDVYKRQAYIHTGGKVTDQNILWENTAEQDTFLEAMADAASTVAKHFAGKLAYVAVMKNLSVDCDCCAVAEDPCMNDVGILSSLDPVSYTHLDVYKRQSIYPAPRPMLQCSGGALLRILQKSRPPPCN